jgi:hypothetical protein
MYRENVIQYKCKEPKNRTRSKAARQQLSESEIERIKSSMQAVKHLAQLRYGLAQDTVNFNLDVLIAELSTTK